MDPDASIMRENRSVQVLVIMPLSRLVQLYFKVLNHTTLLLSTVTTIIVVATFNVVCLFFLHFWGGGGKGGQPNINLLHKKYVIIYIANAFIYIGHVHVITIRIKFNDYSKQNI